MRARKVKDRESIGMEVLRAVRAANRASEIAMYGKTICHSNVYRNKKKYNRKSKHKGYNDNNNIE